MTAWYNENDPGAAEWLRELIKAGQIAPGVVDERDIRDVKPDELRDFVQCHFYAGIGGWSYALRLAGWPDDRPVWTFSEPCQPFSAAGKGLGSADERYLRPFTHHLVSQCRPDVCFGEQVASKDGLGWLDTLQADMEGAGYAGGAVDLCSAGVGAPHIRQRLHFVFERLEHDDDERQPRGSKPYIRSFQSEQQTSRRLDIGGRSGAGRMADPDRRKRDWVAEFRGVERDGENAGRAQGGGELEPRGEPVGVADSNSAAGQQVTGSALGDETANGRARRDGIEPNGDHRSAGDGENRVAGPVNGLWEDADWLFCRDGKWRPVEPGTFPLAHGVSGRVGLLRGYGNAINPWATKEFVEAYIEAKGQIIEGDRHFRLIDLSVSSTTESDIFS